MIDRTFIMRYCQGPICHEYKTKDRIRGNAKGNKSYQTRRRSRKGQSIIMARRSFLLLG